MVNFNPLARKDRPKSEQVRPTNELKESLVNILRPIQEQRKFVDNAIRVQREITLEQSSRIARVEDNPVIQRNFDSYARQTKLITDQLILIDNRFTDYDRIVNEKLAYAVSYSQIETNKLRAEVSGQLQYLHDGYEMLADRVDLQDSTLDNMRGELGRLRLNLKEAELESGRRIQGLEGQLEESKRLAKENKKKDETSWMSQAAWAAAGLAGAGALAGLRKIGQVGTKAAIKVGTAAAAATAATVGAGAAAASKVVPSALKAAGKMAVRVGGRLVPWVGAGMIGYDAYEGYKKDGLKGAILNPLTLGMYSSGSAEASEAAEKTEPGAVAKPKGTAIKDTTLDSSADVLITAQKNIKATAQDTIHLKARRIVMEAPEIVMMSASIKSSGTVTSLPSTGTGSKDTPGITPPINPNDNLSANGGDVSDDSVPASPGPSFAPPMKLGGPTSEPVERSRAHGGVSPMSMRHLNNPSAVGMGYEKIFSQTNFGEFTPGGIDRRQFEKELEDPEVRELFRTMMQAEVGSQGSDAAVGFAETVFNRAYASKKSLKEILSSRSYYQPYQDGGFARAQRGMTDDRRQSLDQFIDKARFGSNLTNLATDNASGGLANRIERGAHNFASGSRVGGELFYNKDYYQKRLSGIPRLPEDMAGDPEFTRNSQQELVKKAESNPHQIVADAFDGRIDPRGRAIDIALTKLGAHESRDKRELIEYIEQGGMTRGSLSGRSNAWCAAFVHASLKQAGIQGIQGNWTASSYKNWGDSVRDAKAVAKGDVLVEDRRNIRPGKPGAHVGMATGRTRIHNGRLQVEMLGGNQSDVVSKKWTDANILNIRRARPDMIDPALMAQTPVEKKEQDIGAEVARVDPNEIKAVEPNQLPEVSMQELPEGVATPNQPVVQSPEELKNRIDATPIENIKEIPAAEAPQVAEVPLEEPVEHRLGTGAGIINSEAPKSEGTSIAADKNASKGEEYAEVKMPRHNRGDSMPPMPGSKGTGSYSNCLI